MSVGCFKDTGSLQMRKLRAIFAILTQRYPEDSQPVSEAILPLGNAFQNASGQPVRGWTHTGLSVMAQATSTDWAIVELLVRHGAPGYFQLIQPTII